MSTQISPGPDGEILRTAFPDIDESERTPTLVSYGLPFEQACKRHVDGFLNANRVYILASRGLASKSDHLKNLEAALGEKHVGTWLGIPAHSPYDSLIPILSDMKAKQADCVVVLGGGSLADGAKLLVYVAENGVDNVEDIIAMEKYHNKLNEETLAGIGNPAKIPLVFMPTTLSGAEYSKWAGCTNPKNHMKVQFTHPSMFAKLLILDGNLCRTTPDWVWRSTGVRAIDHCTENICASKARPESDVACQRGLKRIVKSLFAYTRDPDDLKARLESQLGCNNSMTGLTLGIMCGASHGIGHNLGPLGVGHGETSCVLLPSVMKWNARVNKPQQDTVKNVLWSDSEITGVLEKHGLQKDSSDAGDALRAIFDELGMPRSLKDVGVGKDKWDQLAINSLADTAVIMNPRSITSPEQVKKILEMCSGDE